MNKEKPEFPDITNKKVSGIGYGENTIAITFGRRPSINLVISADKQGNLLINGIPKSHYTNVYNGKNHGIGE